MKNLHLLVLVLIIVTGPKAHGGIFDADPAQLGVDAYESGDYEKSISHFTEALLTEPADPILNYDLAGALYKGGRFEEAQAQYEKLATSASDVSLRQSALYNLGNSQYQQGNLEDAVTSYESALKLDANDQEAKRNLELVRQEIRRRLEEMADQQQERQNQEQENQENPQDPSSQADNQQQPEEGDSGENNPEQQEGGEPTPGDQDSQAQQGNEQQPEENNPQDGQTPEPQAGQQGEPDSNSTPTPGAQGQGQQGENQPEESGTPQPQQVAQGEEGEGAQEAPEGTMNKEDAARLLKQLEDDGRELQRKNMKRKSNTAGNRGFAW